MKNKSKIGNRFLRVWSRLFMAIIILLSVSCSSQQAVTRTESVKITLQTARDVNPNEDGKANPVRVTLYQLIQSDGFLASDYFSLHDGTDPDLNTQVQKSLDVIMVPGETKKITLKIKDDVNALGVITAYRDITDAQWKALYIIPQKPRERWYEKLWRTKKGWQPKIIVRMESLTTSIEKVD